MQPGGRSKNGEIEINNDDATQATQVYIADQTGGGTDVSNYLDTLLVGDKIYIQDQNDATEYYLFELTAPPTANSGYHAFQVNWVESGTGGNLANNAGLVVSLGTGAGSGGGGGTWRARR